MKNTNSRLVDFTVNDDDLIVKARLGNTVYQCNSYPQWVTKENDEVVGVVVDENNIGNAVVPENTVITFLDFSTVGTPSIDNSVTGNDDGDTISELLADDSLKIDKLYVFGMIDDTHYYCVCELGATS